jgi:DNA-directed RNA polymerase subunit N (RpoN/RPB10)
VLYEALVEVLDQVLLKRTKLLDSLVVERVITKRYILSELDLVVVRPM